MLLRDLFKKAYVLTAQAVILSGALAFFYNFSPLSERQVEVVVTDKYPVTHPIKPYVLEECWVDDIKLCTYRNVTRFEYENTPVGEVSVLLLNGFEYDNSRGVASRFILSLSCLISTILYVLVYLPVVKHSTKGVK